MRVRRLKYKDWMCSTVGKVKHRTPFASTVFVDMKILFTLQHSTFLRLQTPLFSSPTLLPPFFSVSLTFLCSFPLPSLLSLHFSPSDTMFFTRYECLLRISPIALHLLTPLTPPGPHQDEILNWECSLKAFGSLAVCPPSS